MKQIPLANLRPHPGNANAMDDRSFQKLVRHIERTRRYPPLIVRPMPGEPHACQVLDGHHRWRALEQLGHASAACVVWDVDDDEATLLLTTLNRLCGRDDPHRRAALLADLHERRGVDELARLLPENADQLRRYLALRDAPPSPAPPQPLSDMPIAVHFFLTGEQKQRLDDALHAAGGTREDALMRLITPPRN